MQKKLAGRLDMDSCGELARTLTGALQGDKRLELDFSAVEAADSAALALILELRRQAAACGATLELSAPTDELCNLARLYGLDALFAPHREDPEP